MPEELTLPEPVPVSGSSVASIPKEDRVSLDRMREYILHHYRMGQGIRKRQMTALLMVQSYLKGLHFFTINALGQWRPIARKDDKKIRVAVPLMVPLYRQALGFLNSNELGVSTIPVASSSKSLFNANHAYAALTSWIDDVDLATTFDRANQLLLMEGTVGLLRYIDTFRETVTVKPIGGSQIYPIPYDARHPADVSGYIIAQVESKSWLELQDDLLERQTGKPPKMRMGDKVSGMSASMTTSLPFMSGAFGSRVEGAVTLTVYMNKNERKPDGEYFFLVEDEIFRYAGQGQTKNILYKGEAPLEIVFFDKNEHEFLGSSFCQTILPAQASRDRSQTQLERSARFNRGFTVIDGKVIDKKKIQDEDDLFITANFDMSSSSFKQPVFHFPPTRVGQDTIALMQIQDQGADRAAGFRSGILFGQQEGRTESGPATSILAQNASLPMVPVLSRMESALRRTYRGVLDWLRVAWPPEKTIRMVGPSNVGKEIKLISSQLPWADELIIQARPLIAGGRTALLNILFQLRQMPGADGINGSEVSSREFRFALRAANFLPPGLELESKAEARIRTRINLLIGDTEKPSISPLDPATPTSQQSLLIMEDHRLAIDMLRDVLLDDSFNMFGPLVQKALVQEMQFHRELMLPTPNEQPNSFDDGVSSLLGVQMEQHLAAAEADFDDKTGDFILQDLQTPT